jgi:hypothetical protein
VPATIARPPCCRIRGWSMILRVWRPIIMQVCVKSISEVYLASFLRHFLEHHSCLLFHLLLSCLLSYLSQSRKLSSPEASALCCNSFLFGFRQYYYSSLLSAFSFLLVCSELSNNQNREREAFGIGHGNRLKLWYHVAKVL